MGEDMARLFAGVDIGSTSTKAVILDDSEKIVAYHIIPSGSDFKKSSRASFEAALEKARVETADVQLVVSTGYGRYITDLTSKAVTEITCCARGARHLVPDVRTIIDVGGQDVKVIKVSEEGKVTDFALNDKCAAGTGRFLERIAASLGLSIEEMAELSLKSAHKIAISNTCTVFAESEVISRISNGEPLEDIVRGLHSALASRIAGLAQRVGVQPVLLLCGGGAKNAGLVRELEELLGEVKLPPEDIDPRLVPAIGAALFAKEFFENKSS